MMKQQERLQTIEKMWKTLGLQQVEEMVLEKNENEDNCDAEMKDEDALSEVSDIGSQVMEDTYSLEEINDFLDTTFGKAFDVKEFFPDVEKL